jgi:hypothetical protein
MMKQILAGRVLWSYDYEVLQRELLNEIGAHFSRVNPFHPHAGEITLTDDKLFITGDEDIEIPLGSLEQIYLGFDEVFPRTLVKNFGLFWQPLRLTLLTGDKLYLIIDYNMFGAKNRLWFNELKEMLSA